MNATTSISKEEFLNKIEKAKKALDDVPHYNRSYLLDDVLLDKLFDLAYNSIPIEWLKKWAKDNSNGEWSAEYRTVFNGILKDWENREWPQ